MASVLEFDWGSKTANAIEEGSVNIFMVELASPRRLMPHISLLCRMGRCPVIDCFQILEKCKRTQCASVGTLEETATEWICKKCYVAARRSAQVNAQEDYSSPIGKSSLCDRVL